MNDRQPINIPQVPADAALPQIDDELEEVNRKLLECKDEQIKQLTEIVAVQRRMIEKLEEQLNTLLYGGGCGGHCGGDDR